MNKIIMTISMMALIAVFFHPTTIYATNQSSYHYGFSRSVDDYSDCYTGWTSDEGCALNGHNEPMAECYVGAGPGNVTNSTACFDGYIDGWKHWCQKNAKDCVGLITKSDVFPGSLVSDNKTALSGLKALSFIAGTWNFVNETHGVNNMTGIGKSTSGIITFRGGSYSQDSGSNATFIETIGGKVVHVSTCIKPCIFSINKLTSLYGSGGWTSDGHQLVLSFNGGVMSFLKLTTVTANHIELQDTHLGNTIHLMR